MSSLFQKQERTSGPRPKAGTPFKVMLVDDSAVIRGLMSRWIDSDPDIQVVCSVANGKQAVDQVAKTGAEVVVLDIEMPVMDGITALPLILEAAPNVRVVMSSTLTRRGADISLKAMSLGASDYVPKPDTTRGVTTSEEFRKEILDKIKALAGGVRASGGVASAPARRSKSATTAAPAFRVAKTSAKIELRPMPRVMPKVLAVASSTGGPQALFDVFSKLGPKLTIPVLITQHMPATFTSILAEHLTKASGKPAKEGENGEVVKPATIYVAPGGKHMLVEKVGETVRIKLDDGPPENFCKPAADPMFRSIAKAYGGSVLSVVLTGMGHDGREGVRDILDAGGALIAQDETTSVVWGMPGAVAEAGLCSDVLPLGLISDKIIKIVKGGRL